MSVKLLLHSDGQFDRAHPVGPAIWPHFDFLFIHSGSVRLILREKDKIMLSKNQGILIFPHTKFCGEVETPRVRASVMHFSISNDAGTVQDPLFSKLESLRNGYLLSSSKPSQATAIDVKRAMTLAAQAANPIRNEMREALLKLCIAPLFIRTSLQKEESASAQNMESIGEWIRGNLGKLLSMRQLASRAGCSESHFRVRFFKHYGVSPGKYIRQLRVNEARQLLRETRKPIKEIAEEMGYSDSVSFHRSFVQVARYTPHLYRQKFSPKG